MSNVSIRSAVTFKGKISPAELKEIVFKHLRERYPEMTDNAKFIEYSGILEDDSDPSDYWPRHVWRGIEFKIEDQVKES